MFRVLSKHSSALPVKIAGLQKVGTTSPLSAIPPKTLLQSLSYSHIEQLVDLDDDIKRPFYEIECIRSNWSVRELKRQIATLYYERSGLSNNKERLAELVKSAAERTEPKLMIRIRIKKDI